MKIRFYNNSARFRLRKSDMDVLRTGVLEEIIVFPGDQKLVFRIQIGDVPELTATLKEHSLEITLPAAKAKTWMETEQVSIERSLDGSNSSLLKILLEKDFPCDHKPMENKSDTFRELAAKKRN